MADYDIPIPPDKTENIPQHELNRRWAEEQAKRKYFEEQKEKERLAIEQQQLEAAEREWAAEQKIAKFTKGQGETKLSPGAWIGPESPPLQNPQTPGAGPRQRIYEGQPPEGDIRRERNWIGDLTPEEQAIFKKNNPMPR